MAVKIADSCPTSERRGGDPPVRFVLIYLILGG